MYIRSSINRRLQVYLFKLTKHRNQHILFHLRLFLPSYRSKKTHSPLHPHLSFPPLASPHPFSHSKAFTNTQPITHFPHSQLWVDRVWLRHQSSCSCTSWQKKEMKNQNIRSQHCRTLHRKSRLHSSRYLFFAEPTEGERVCVSNRSSLNECQWHP